MWGWEVLGKLLSVREEVQFVSAAAGQRSEREGKNPALLNGSGPSLVGSGAGSFLQQESDQRNLTFRQS